MSSFIYQERNVSIIYVKGPGEPTSRETPVARKMWAATLTIENVDFNSDMAEPSSKAFEDLARGLEVLLSGAFEHIPGFLNVEIESFEKGSIICNFFIYMTAESSVTAKEYENALIAASRRGETGSYHITNVQVEDSVEAVKRDKPQDKSFHPLKVIGVPIFAGAVLMVIVVFLAKVNNWM